MAAHNGKVTVRSVEGAGSTFTLFIPLRSRACQHRRCVSPGSRRELRITGSAQEEQK